VRPSDPGSVINGFWEVTQAINPPQPTAYLTFNVQGNAVAVTGVATLNKINEPFTAAGLYIGKLPLNSFRKYHHYKVREKVGDTHAARVVHLLLLAC